MHSGLAFILAGGDDCFTDGTCSTVSVRLASQDLHQEIAAVIEKSRVSVEARGEHCICMGDQGRYGELGHISVNFQAL